VVPCPECGYQNVQGTLFCESCGGDLVTGAHSPRRDTGAVSPLSGGVAAVEVRVDEALTEPVTVEKAPDEVAPAASTEEEPAGLVASPPAYLVSESGRRVEVPVQDVVIVGREDMRSGIRPDIDLTLDGASAAGVSRRHCRLLRQEGGWYIEDLMSTNFTVLNGTPLTAHTPALLHDNDEVRLGKMRLRFHQA
jgi:FHA domain-containing protein